MNRRSQPEDREIEAHAAELKLPTQSPLPVAGRRSDARAADPDRLSRRAARSRAARARRAPRAPTAARGTVPAAQTPAGVPAR